MLNFKQIDLKSQAAARMIKEFVDRGILRVKLLNITNYIMERLMFN
jgi:hypothetical protein